MTETQWRFLKAISDRVPDGRIVEVRLFPAIRQGGAESGVAVVAVEELHAQRDEAAAMELAAVAAAEAEGLPPELTEAIADQGDGTASIDTEDVQEVWEKPRLIADLPVSDDAASEILTIAHSADVASDSASTHGHQDVDDVEVTTSHAASDHEVTLHVDLGDAEGGTEAAEPGLTLDDMLDMAASDAGVAAAPSAPKRYAVLAARYRLTLKGPDRGHWDFEITHEADAPLDTVDRVARGVARRAGDEGDPESFSAFQLQSTLSQPWWNSAT